MLLHLKEEFTRLLHLIVLFAAFLGLIRLNLKAKLLSKSIQFVHFHLQTLYLKLNGLLSF